MLANSDYELDIISTDSSTVGKVFKKYFVDNSEIIGVQDNEPFAISFKNKTLHRVQVRIAVNGIDVLTGQVMTGGRIDQMLAVEPYQTLTIKSWQETKFLSNEFLFGVSNGSRCNIQAVVFYKDTSSTIEIKYEWWTKLRSNLLKLSPAILKNLTGNSVKKDKARYKQRSKIPAVT